LWDFWKGKEINAAALVATVDIDGRANKISFVIVVAAEQDDFY
jgi:hypothetical protein